ncbi:MAG TPA: NUDIX hydrolase [Pseudobacteroides sp.]|nr:NUDIX hydrolase [Pseudobacteroides sp.]
MQDEKVYDGWLKVFKRKIGDRTYDILKDYDAVAAVVVNEYNELLLVKQFRPALMEETLEIPAGCLDINGEDEISSIVREISEETGLGIKPEEAKHILSYKPMVGFSNSLMKLYLINVKKDLVKVGRVEDEDVYEVLWMDIDKLGEDISQGKNIDVKTILAYYYLKSLKY